MVCNYGVGGNYMGEPVYKSGAVGSDCANGAYTDANTTADDKYKVGLCKVK